jgi:acyl carrier protein
MKSLSEKGEAIYRLLCQLDLINLPRDPEVVLKNYGFDSLATVRLVSRLEEEFSLKFDYKEFTPEIFFTIQSIENFIQKKLGEK